MLKKHIASLTVCSGPPLVCDGPHLWDSLNYWVITKYQSEEIMCCCHNIVKISRNSMRRVARQPLQTSNCTSSTGAPSWNWVERLEDRTRYGCVYLSHLHPGRNYSHLVVKFSWTYHWAINRREVILSRFQNIERGLTKWSCLQS